MINATLKAARIEAALIKANVIVETVMEPRARVDAGSAISGAMK